MSDLTFAEVAALVNHVDNMRLDVEPFASDLDQWSLHRGQIRGGGLSMEFRLLYIRRNATRGSLEKARSSLVSGERLQVVHSDRLRMRLDAVAEVLGDSAGAIQSTRSYLQSLIKEQLDKYLRGIRNYPLDSYINPSFSVPFDLQGEVRNAVLSWLGNERVGGSSASGSVGVLLADPGQGKTFTTRYMASRLTRSRFVPVYIDSGQWHSMQPGDVKSLEKVILHSFDEFSASIGWVVGHEGEFLDVTLRAGLFRIIFDGFDEYIHHSRGAIDPSEVLESIRELAARTGARILVTSRTSFWESEIAASGSVPEHGQVLEFRMRPFDRRQALTYFKSRFPASEKKVSDAIDLYDELRGAVGGQGPEEFVGRGFFLFLIADLVHRSKGKPAGVGQGRAPIEWMLYALCERESHRQNLKLSADVQMQVMRLLAEFSTSERGIETDDVNLIVDAVTDLDEAGTKAVVAVLADHPLVRQLPGACRWEFTQEQVRLTLLAEHILQTANSQAAAAALRNAVESAMRDEDLWGSVALTVLEQVKSRAQPRFVNRDLTRFIKQLMDCAGSGVPNAATRSPVRYLMTGIALAALDRQDRAEQQDAHVRMSELVELIGEAELAGLFFSGRLPKLDFRNKVVRHCRFERVAFARCVFDSSTVFDRCHFVNCHELQSSGFGEADWRANCVLDDSTRVVVDHARLAAGKHRYRPADLAEDIRRIVTLFLPRASGGFRRVPRARIAREVVAHGMLEHTLASHLLTSVLEEVPVNDREEPALQVRADQQETFVNYANNRVLTGGLAELYDGVRRTLGG